MNKPDVQFVKLFRVLVRSDAWRSASINVRRLLDFLMLEHMGNGARENGRLKAPRLQLVNFGISARHISTAIADAERLGLIECRRQGLRVATLYRLTWLDAPGKPATNEWRDFTNEALKPLSKPKSKNLVSEGKSALVPEGKSDGSNLVSEGKSDRPKSLVSEGKHLSRKHLTRAEDISSGLSVGAERPPVVDGAGLQWAAGLHGEWPFGYAHNLAAVGGARR